MAVAKLTDAIKILEQESLNLARADCTEVAACVDACQIGRSNSRTRAEVAVITSALALLLNRNDIIHHKSGTRSLQGIGLLGVGSRCTQNIAAYCLN